MNFTLIDHKEVFSNPEFQKKLKFVFGRDEGDIEMTFSREAFEVIDAIGEEAVVFGMTEDGELVLIPGADEKGYEKTVEFKAIAMPMMDSPHWVDPVVRNYLSLHLKDDGRWEFQGRYDKEIDGLVFSLKDGKALND